jgi:hypothetical protein
MTNPINSELSDALSTRLNLQISLSALPVVEEWMDPKLGRWLESVPLPPELPPGELANFVVTVSTDLNYLRWGAYGHPEGFIPKMAEYLSKCGVQPKEVEVINHLGATVQPKVVGTWVQVDPGAVTTGWHFISLGELKELTEHLKTTKALETFLLWADDHDISRCRRFSRAIGDAPYSDISVALPGGQEGELAAAAGALDVMLGVALPQTLIDAFATSPEDALSLVVRIAGDDILKVSVIGGTLSQEAVKSLASAYELEYSEQIAPLTQSLLCRGFEFVEVGFTRDATTIDLHLIPGSGQASDRDPN